MLPILKQSGSSPLAEAPPLTPLDSLCVAGRPAKAMRLPSHEASTAPAKRIRHSKAENLELHFLSLVLSEANHTVKDTLQYEDAKQYFATMAAMILAEAKGVVSEMQKGQNWIGCKTALEPISCHSMMEFDIPQKLDTETWSAFLAESRRIPSFPVVVRRGAGGKHMGVLADGFCKTSSALDDFDGWLYPSSPAFLGDLWRQWEACQSRPEEGPLLREILGPTLCVSGVEGVQTHSFQESGLNDSQMHALNMCVSSQKCMHCIQGPPGTGKSKTILELVDCLARDAGPDELFLVASMTNKACQLLASKFRQAKRTRSIPVALAGNMKKLPPDAAHLRNIFVHGMGSYLAEQVCQAERKQPDSFGEQRGKVCRWLSSWAPSAFEKMQEFQTDSFSNLTMALESLDANLESELLGRARILFATLSTLARPQVREQATCSGKRRVKWVIVDEASQAVEAQMLPVLVWSPERSLLVGDTKQLTAATSQRGGDAGYGRSLMSRLEDLGMVPHMLNVQYRMLPPISHFPSQHYYNSKLRDAQAWEHLDPSAMLSDWLSKKCPMKCEFVPAYVLLNLSGQERRAAGASRANDQEAEFCVHLASSLLRGALGEEKARDPARAKCIIITFYAGQKDALEQLASQLPQATRPQIHTVDSFQGSEAEQVVISFVRSNCGGHIGFLSDYRRLNVALTRAKRSLFLIGDMAFMKSTDSDLAKLVQDAESRGLVADGEQVHECILPEVYARTTNPEPAVRLVPSDVASQRLVNQMSLSQKIDTPLSALI